MPEAHFPRSRPHEHIATGLPRLLREWQLGGLVGRVFRTETSPDWRFPGRVGRRGLGRRRGAAPTLWGAFGSHSACPGRQSPEKAEQGVLPAESSACDQASGLPLVPCGAAEGNGRGVGPGGLCQVLGGSGLWRGGVGVLPELGLRALCSCWESQMLKERLAMGGRAADPLN